MEACYRMKPLILTAMTVIGLFGIIGTVEYAHAHTIDEAEYHSNHKHIESHDICDLDYITQDYEEFLIIQSDILQLEYPLLMHQQTWLDQPPINITQWFESHNNNSEDITFTLQPSLHGTSFLYTMNTNNEKICSLTIHTTHKDLNQFTINLIAETFNLELPEPIEPDETTQTNWKERYNTCYDKKENLKTVRDTYKSELSELQSNFDILQSNLTNANFEIDKLKQEKAQLIKQVETLETQLQEN